MDRMARALRDSSASPAAVARWGIGIRGATRNHGQPDAVAGWGMTALQPPHRAITPAGTGVIKLVDITQIEGIRRIAEAGEVFLDRRRLHLRGNGGGGRHGCGHAG